MNPLKLLVVAEAIQSLSKDPSTKIGCVIFDDDSNILSTGFNGLPRGVADTDRRLYDREMKYKFVCHSEANAIAQAARTGARLLGSNLLLTSMYPCSNCAKLIIQAGIKAVYAPKIEDTDAQKRWQEEVNITKIMFKESGVIVYEY